MRVLLGQDFDVFLVAVDGLADDAQQLVLRRYRDFDDVNPRVMSVAAPERPDNWDTANWDSASWDAGQTAPALVRDHTVLASVSLAVESLDATSGLTIFGCKLIGLPEQA